MATKKAKGNATGPGNQSQLRFNEGAVSDKVSESGFHFFYGASNAEGLLGDIAAGADVPKFRPVMLCNSTAGNLFVAFGDSGLAAPTGGANGVMIPANSCVVLSSGDNVRVRSSAAGVFAYVADDNVVE